MLFRLAFRNVFRNKKRTFLSALSIFFAAIIVGMAQGWVNGMTNLYLDNFVKYQTGHLRVTTKLYKKRERFLPVDELISNSESIKKKVLKIEGISKIEERIRFGILLGKGERTVEAIGLGMDLENNEFDIKDKLQKGTIHNSGMYIGEKLAKKLDIEIGEKLLIATKTSKGGLNGIKVEVRGIVRLGVGNLDKKFFYISLPEAKKLLKIKDATSEFYIYAKNIKLTDNLESSIKSILPSNMKVATYKEQMGSFYESIKMAKTTYAVIEIVILFMASFVIINTMMMTIFERIKEIGTMKALGFSDNEIFLNFTWEGFIIAILGGIPGVIIGFLIIALISEMGINFEAYLKNLDLPINYIIHPKLRMIDVFIGFAISLLVPVLAAMIPARYVKKYTAAEALRK